MREEGAGLGHRLDGPLQHLRGHLPRLPEAGFRLLLGRYLAPPLFELFFSIRREGSRLTLTTDLYVHEERVTAAEPACDGAGARLDGSI